MTEKVVFLLGAGASKDAGLPLMNELTERFLPWLSDKPNPRKETLKNLFQASVDKVSVVGPPNIELVLELLAGLHALKSGPAAEAAKEWNSPFDAEPALFGELSEEIRKYILSSLLTPLAKESEYLHGLTDFWQEGEPVDVFTLNYDRLVESMAARFQVRFTTGFGETWDPTQFEHVDWKLRLYKLHGSVNWFRVDNVVYRGSGDDPPFRGEPQEVLIYPAAGKAAHADPFSTLMSYFNRALSSARYCVAIGYSFRDLHIRRAVLDRMLTNQSLQLLLVSPSANEVASTPQEVDEPKFEEFKDRIIGLSSRASQALLDRDIARRIQEAETADRQLRDAVAFRNRGFFAEAARELVSAMEHCRLHDLPYKPLGILNQPKRDSFKRAIAAHIGELGQFIDLRSVETLPPSDFASRMGKTVALWALAENLYVHDDERRALEGTLKGVFAQLASLLLFSKDGRYSYWHSETAVSDPVKLVEGRIQRLEALDVELRDHPPVAALGFETTKTAGIGGNAQPMFEKFLQRTKSLLDYYYALIAPITPGAQARIRVQTYDGHPILIPDRPDWQDVVALASRGFLDAGQGAAGLRATWLPPPSTSRPLAP